MFANLLLIPIILYVVAWLYVIFLSLSREPSFSEKQQGLLVICGLYIAIASYALLPWVFYTDTQFLLILTTILGILASVLIIFGAFLSKQKYLLIAWIVFLVGVLLQYFADKIF